jgi:hypothetical protein
MKEDVVRRKTLALLATVVSLLVGAAVAPPAQAAAAMRFEASPEPVKKGAYVTLSGHFGGLAADWDMAEIDFFFKADGTSTWVYQNFVRPDAKGNFSRRQAQNHSGTWRAQFWACEDCRPHSLTDHVAVRGVQKPGFVNRYSGYYVNFSPSTVDISADGSWYVTKFRWTARTMSTGHATGVEHYNDCIPYCAAGHWHTRPVKMTFSRVAVHHGALAFTRLYVGSSAPFHLYPSS